MASVDEKQGHGRVLEFDKVTKSFAKTDSNEITHALAEVNLTIQPGEFVSIVGTSGCGKSTILRLIAGLIRPTTGEIRLGGKPIVGAGPDRGMVFQKATLFPWLTVEKNVSFSLRMQKKQDKELVEHMLKMVGLEDFRKDYPHQLSGGMAQRVALVRSLINHPDILLLDEPLGALDAFTRMNMQALLSAIPEADPHKAKANQRIPIKGEIPSPINPKNCCRFAERCQYATERCFKEMPQMKEIAPGHKVACHLVEDK